MTADFMTPLADAILGASCTGLGGAVLLIYRNTVQRIAKVERQQAALFALLVPIAMKVGVDQQIIKDFQAVIRSGS